MSEHKASIISARYPLEWAATITPTRYVVGRWVWVKVAENFWCENVQIKEEKK